MPTLEKTMDEFEQLLEESFAKSNNVADIVEGTVIKKEQEGYLISVKGAKMEAYLPNKELSSEIKYIIVEGHTDSHMFAGVNSKDEQFQRNMDLSLKRANAVADYMFKTGYSKEYSDKFRKILVVEGKSFNEPILTNGVEDFDKSRRVELKLKVQDWDVATALGLKK